MPKVDYRVMRGQIINDIQKVCLERHAPSVFEAIEAVKTALKKRFESDTVKVRTRAATLVRQLLNFCTREELEQVMTELRETWKWEI